MATNILPAPDEMEKIEIKLLLEAIYQCYGFDFRDYNYPTIKRSIQAVMDQDKLTSVSALQEKIIHYPGYIGRLLRNFSIPTTAMFRDPDFFLGFRARVIPWLRTYPFIRIWTAGCSTGEEVYSMAILLKEEGLYRRTRLYATDYNDFLLEKAKEGVFPQDRMEEYHQNYLRAGGKASLSDYYTAGYDRVKFSRELAGHIVFGQHNLVTDASFNEFNVILCRNVMIYFNRELQNRTHKLLYQSLIRHGILCLGDKESIRFSPYEQCYEEMDSLLRLYKKIK